MLRTFRSMLGGGLTHGAGLPAMTAVRIGLSLCAAVLFAPTVSADVIRLRTGESIKGKLIPDRNAKDRLLLFTLIGKTPMALTKAQVVSVTPEPSTLDEYAVHRATAPTTAPGELALGDWCLEKGLKDLASAHFEQALKLDPTLDAAHEKLGHVRIKGEWMTRDQARAAKGLILHKGKWLTPEEYELKKQEESSVVEQSTWHKKLAALMKSYRAGPENRRFEVEKQLLAIDDPAAVHAVAKTLGTAPEPELRILAARILGGMKAEESASALVGRFLAETDQGVREAAVTELAKKESRLVVPKLAAVLKGKSVEGINRAAWALGQLKATDAVPRLVEALVKVDYRMVWVDQQQANPGSIGAMVPQDGFMISGGRNIPVLTGPVVGGGAVAFGATSVPPLYYSGMSMGLGGPNRGPVPKMETFTQRNTEVLASLKSLTGQDFGYDANAWRQWVRRSFRPDPSPVKRIEQP